MTLLYLEYSTSTPQPGILIHQNIPSYFYYCTYVILVLNTLAVAPPKKKHEKKHKAFRLQQLENRQSNIGGAGGGVTSNKHKIFNKHGCIYLPLRQSTSREIHASSISRSGLRKTDANTNPSAEQIRSFISIKQAPYVLSAWSVKTRRAPSRRCGDARACSLIDYGQA